MDRFEAQISEMELQTAVNNLKNKNSPGEDKIHPEILKHPGTEARKTILLWFQKNMGNGTRPFNVEKSYSHSHIKS